MLMVVLTAGHETTGNFIGNAVLALIDRPDQRARLQERPEGATLYQEVSHISTVSRVRPRLGARAPPAPCAS